MADCVFCQLIAGKSAEDVIFEDEKVLVILDKDWAVKGHTMVIWKKHFTNASQLSLKDFKYFAEVFHKTEKALLKFLGVDRSVILKCGGYVSHFHFHIYPVRKQTSWQEIVDIFSKKVRYQPKPGEKEELLTSLRKHLQ